MSWGALAWAAKCRVGKAADKLILLALAERHNPESNTAYPSIAWLAEFSSLDRKTVISALDRLEDAGLIADSGVRAGRTLQIKAYSLSLETVPKTEQSPKRNGSVFPVKESQKRDTDTVTEPVSSEDKSSSDLVEQFVEAWADLAAQHALKPIRKLSPTRRKKISTFIRHNGIDDITEAIGLIPQSPHLLGQNDRGWKIFFDWFLKPENFTKVLEGTYVH